MPKLPLVTQTEPEMLVHFQHSKYIGHGYGKLFICALALELYWEGGTSMSSWYKALCDANKVPKQAYFALTQKMITFFSTEFEPKFLGQADVVYCITNKDNVIIGSTDIQKIQAGVAIFTLAMEEKINLRLVRQGTI